MLNIMIVDDELIILNGIKAMIENFVKSEIPIDIRTAMNVPEAINNLKEFQPDLFLVDINMPVLTGFDLIEHIRREGYQVDIIILTSYAEFDYARQALRYQITDYIVKPINMDALISAVENAWKKKQEKLQEKIADYRNKFSAMMLYDISCSELLLENDFVQEMFPQPYYTVLVAEGKEVCGEMAAEVEQLIISRLEACMVFFFSDARQIVAICNHSQFDERRKEIGWALAARWPSVEVGLSVCSNSLEELRNLYLNAVRRIFYQKTFRKSTFLAESTFFTYQNCLDIFQESILERQRELILAYLEKTGIKSDNSADIWNRIYKSYCYNIQFYLDNIEVCRGRIIVSAVADCGNQEELIDSILKENGRIRESVGRQESETNSLVTHLLDYIRINYRNDLSLNELGDEVGLHPNYVSALIKKETGESYLYFLHQERIRKAQKLLLSTKKNVEQIAQEVGYASSVQLLRVFKKYVHMSPTEYKTANS